MGLLSSLAEKVGISIPSHIDPALQQQLTMRNITQATPEAVQTARTTPVVPLKALATGLVSTLAQTAPTTTKTSTSSVITPPPSTGLVFKVGQGLSPTQQQTAQQTIDRNIQMEQKNPSPQLVDAKIPFVNKTLGDVGLGAGTGGTGPELIKGVIEWPERVGNTIKEIFSKQHTLPTDAEQLKINGKINPQVPTAIDEFKKNITSDPYFQAHPYQAASLAFFSGVLDLLPVGQAGESSVAKALDSLPENMRAVEGAKLALGFSPSEPVTAEELTTARNRLAQVLHPDKGGTAEAFTKLQDNFNILKEEAAKQGGTIAPLSMKDKVTRKVAETLNTKVGDLFKTSEGTPYLNVKGLLPEQAGTVPAEPYQPYRQPAMGMSTREVQAEPIIPKPETTPSVQNPSPIVKDRTFIKSVLESPNVPEDTKKIVQALPKDNLYYNVYTDQAAVDKAQSLVQKSPDEAVQFVTGAKETDKDVVTTGIELMRKYRLEGNHEMEAKIAANLAEKATTSGQAVQAFSILDKLSPEGVLVYASKQIGQPLSSELAGKLGDMMNEIQNLPYGFEKMKKLQELGQTIARETPQTIGEKAKNLFLEVANIPRAIQSSMDFSFGLRQGLVALPSHPKEFSKAFVSQFKPFFGEKYYDQLMNDVVTNPDFQLAAHAGVPFSDVNAKMKLREEQFASSLAEKIPLLGRVIKGSNRAYTGMANKLRMDIFSSMVKNFEDMGYAPRTDEKMLKEIGNFVGDITGRGALTGVWEKASPLLNTIFYSPRLAASRLHLLNPVRYMKQSAPIRREYLKTMLAFGTFVTTVLGLASLNKNVKVGTDPRSADFGKIRIGDTRLDVAGGFQQYLRMAAQMITGKYISSTTGKVITLGEGYKPLTRWDIFLRGMESKEAPVISFLSTLAKGQDATGAKINIPKEVASRFVPLVLSDIYSLYKTNPKLLPAGFLAALGVGTQTYPDAPAYVKLNEINNSPDPKAAFEQLKKDDPKLADQVKAAKITENFTEFDWSLTYMGVENGDRAQFLYEQLKEKPKTEAAAMWDDLKKKRLISPRVEDQIRYLMANPDFKRKK